MKAEPSPTLKPPSGGQPPRDEMPEEEDARVSNNNNKKKEESFVNASSSSMPAPPPIVVKRSANTSSKAKPTTVVVKASTSKSSSSTVEVAKRPVAVVSNKNENKMTKPTTSGTVTTASTVVSIKRTGLLDPFTSMSFQEVKIVTLTEKLGNFYTGLKRMIFIIPGLSELATTITAVAIFILLYLVVIRAAFGGPQQYDQGGHLILVLCVCVLIAQAADWILSLWFVLVTAPLQILVEAKTHSTQPAAYFIVTDKRSRWSRAIGWRLGSQLELAPLSKPDQPLLSTSTEMLGLPGWFCCCLCFVAGKIKLTVNHNGTEDQGASMVLVSFVDLCCGFCSALGSLCNPIIDAVRCSDGSFVNFVHPMWWRRCSCLCSKTSNVNVISPNDELEEHQLAVNRTGGFSCMDFLLQATDLIALDETINDTVEDIKDELNDDALQAMENAAAAANFAADARDLKDYYDEVLATFKEKGYKRIKSSSSTWDVSFSPNMSNSQKQAVVLYVLAQYTCQRFRN